MAQTIPRIKKRPIVVQFNTCDDIERYVLQRTITQDLINLGNTIYQERKHPFINECSKYVADMTKDELDRKNEYYNTICDAYQMWIELLDTYIIKNKVKGQIRIAEKKIKTLRETKSKLRERSHMWGVPY